MKNRLVILNHIGVSDPKILKNELDIMIESVREYTHNAFLILAFNSTSTIEKLANNGIKIMGINEALRYSSENNYKSITVIPLHLVSGNDYNKLASIIKSFNPCIELKSPLLTNHDDCNLLASIIYKTIHPKDLSKPIIMVTHGTKNVAAKLYFTLSIKLKELGLDAYTMTLHGSLNDIFKQIKIGSEVVLYPLFTVGGYHMKSIFNSNNGIKSQFTEKEFRIISYNRGLLTYKEIRDLYLKKI